MREAQWLVSPVEEREFAALRRRYRVEGRLIVWFAGLSVVGAIMSVILFINLLESKTSVIALVLVLALTVALSFLPFWFAARDLALDREVFAWDAARREEFGYGEGWIVKILIQQGNAPTGADRGMLWIEGSRLCFSGMRTSFALDRNDLAGRRRSVVPIAGLRHSTLLPLACQTPAGRLSLSIQAMEGEHQLVRHTIDVWAARESLEEGQIPPTPVGPGVVSEALILVHAVWASVYWCVTLVLLSRFERTEIGLIAFIALSLSGLGAVLRCWYPLTRWLAWRDRRRLERAQWKT